ncbi:MAG: Hsp20/alpha crystallin family protein [Clostridium sp.]|nr:Hsp20/alpha crystallin family protein [Clostridium sp.]
MLMPSIFGETLLDDFFGFPKERYVKTNNTGLMQTDISESDDNFSLVMNLPGFKKEDVKAELKDGYLTINASTNTSREEKDDNGTYIRKERYSGSCSRSFYIGEAVTQEDIKAKFEDGTLKITVPKKEQKPEVEEAKYIAIEG